VIGFRQEQTMQYPPLKTIQAVASRQIDQRARRSATHFRNFFRCLDKDGQATSNEEEEIVSIEMTQRCKDYYDSICAADRSSSQPARAVASN
jgi:hypothetical protein